MVPLTSDTMFGSNPVSNLIRHLLTLIVLLCFGIAPAHPQPLPSHQPLSVRHVCAPAPLSPEPGRPPLRSLNAGDEIRIRDITFGADGLPYFAVDTAPGSDQQPASGFVPAKQVFSYCNFASRSDGGQNFLAPPNTCHLIAAQANSLSELNKQALALEKFRPSMAAYRTADGHYVLSLGLLNLRASQTILKLASGLPSDSACATGTGYTEALLKNQNGFSEAGYQQFATAEDRRTAQNTYMRQAEQSTDATNFRHACDLGLAEACTRYAEAVYSADDPDGTLPATVTHYALMGCMGGNVPGCKLAINRAENTLENAQFRALDGGTGNPADQVGPELARTGCDAQQAVSCILFARAIAPDTTPTPAEAASSFAAKLSACRSGIVWTCEELTDAFAKVIQARGDYASATANENFALGSLEEEICTPGPAKPNVVHCKTAYYKYRDFLQTTNTLPPSDSRVLKAKQLLQRGCMAGDPAACATQTRLADHWSSEDRNAAAARAVDLCRQQAGKDSICDNLGAALDPHLSSASPASHDAYNALARQCTTDQTASGPQACLSAVSVYATLKDQNQAPDIRAMLNSACHDDNINGCQALASFISAQPRHQPSGDSNDKDRIAALRAGCRFDDGPASTCLALASALASGDDTATAMDVLARTCDHQISHASGRLQNVDICYNAAKFALAEKTRYADALRWSEFACSAEDQGLSPYACKLAGNIFAAGYGTGVNPQEAVAAYQNGCFHPYVSTTDGEACIRYGTLLLNAQNEADRTGIAHITLPGHMYNTPLNSADTVSEASRAFDMGCMDNIEQACALNRKLLNDWSEGQFPHQLIRCRVQDESGSVSSDKTCRAFSFYQAAGQHKQQRQQIRLAVYVWPDGDRTVVYQKDGRWLLNEVITDGARDEGATRCFRNPVSKRSFCVIQAPQ